MPFSNISARSMTAALTAISAASAGAMWTRVLVDQWPRLMALGRLCSHSGGLLAHGAACSPAAALTGLAIGGGISLVYQAYAIQRPAAAAVTQINRLA